MFLDDFLALHPKKHLIFDLDSTILTLLIDWESWRNGLWETVASIDQSIFAMFPDKTGATAAQLYNATVKKHGQAARATLLKYCHHFELEHVRGTKVNRSLARWIASTGTNYTLSVWSSNNHMSVERALKKHKLHRFFANILAKEEVLLLKPEPDGFYAIFDAKMHDRADFLMIGDSISDRLAAEAAGIEFFQI